MPKGSCNCAEWTYEFEGEPADVVVCHCIPCKKTAGSNGSYNLIIPSDKFKKLSGTDRPYERPGESGHKLTMTFCDSCHVYMTAAGAALPGVIVVKGGTVDDKLAENAFKPRSEILTRNRPEWCAALPVPQKDGQ